MSEQQDKTVMEERPRLLLVDDDDTFCHVLSQALEKRGYEVLTAKNLEQAIKQAEDYEPEYAVVDLRIGHESGLVVVKRLKEFDENTRIVMLTGYASIATAVEAIKLGALHYLTKPTDTDEIINALHHDEGDADIVPVKQPISVKRLEWEHLQKILLENNGNISAAARALGMHRRTLQRKLNKRPVRK